MEKKKVEIFTLNEFEIKNAIRAKLIDILGTEVNIGEDDIELEAEVTMDDRAYNFKATYTKITDALIETP